MKHIITAKLVVSSTSRTMNHCSYKDIIHNFTLKLNHLGLNGIWTHDLCNMGALLYQLSYQDRWELVKMLVHRPYA